MPFDYTTLCSVSLRAFDSFLLRWHTMSDDEAELVEAEEESNGGLSRT